MQPNLQTTILRNLINNEAFTRKVIPFIKRDYFEGDHRIVFGEVVSFVNKYAKLPTGEALAIEVKSQGRANDENCLGIIGEISKPQECNFEWLVDTTEKWCQERALYLAIVKACEILDGNDTGLAKDGIPDLLSEALAVGFDKKVGHDYTGDASLRFEFYHRQEERIPFDLDLFNAVTKGGLPKKTLNIAMAGTGVGKSLFMCHVAGSALGQGRNALYITMEMAEERIAERIDANLLNVKINDLPGLSEDVFTDKVAQFAAKTHGKLFIKEYPTGAAHAGHFRALLKELKLKKNFVPDILFIDYLNICASSRMKGMGGAINSFSYVKSVAEEIRGLAVEFDLPVVSATQTNRAGFSSSDVDLDNVSESFGVPATADFMFALMTNDELDALDQMVVKQLKNRYNDPSANRRFVIGVDRPRMRLYNAEESAQNILGDHGTDDDYDEKFQDFNIG